MNRSEAQANNRAIDSLINYETVKYCGNEQHEVARYDECMHKYQVRALTLCPWRGRGFGGEECKAGFSRQMDQGAVDTTREFEWVVFGFDSFVCLFVQTE